MSLRTALLLLAFLLACGSLASLALAGEDHTDPAHEEHECIVCVVATADDDDPDELLPSEFACSSGSSTGVFQLSKPTSEESSQSEKYQPRGPPTAVAL
ncbi:MAG: hypothetical protein AAGF33_12765 [Pseudomonadota bacterium]